MEPDTLNHWRPTIKKVLTELAAIPFPDVVTMSAKTVFDEGADVYLVIDDEHRLTKDIRCARVTRRDGFRLDGIAAVARKIKAHGGAFAELRTDPDLSTGCRTKP